MTVSVGILETEIGVTYIIFYAHGSSMSLVANFFRGIAESWANMRGCERRIIFDENNFRVDYVKPKSTDSRYWGDHYPWGNIYYKDYANPIKVQESDLDPEKLEVITTEKWKTFMEQDVIRDAFKTSTDALDMSAKLQIATVIMLGVIAALLLT